VGSGGVPGKTGSSSEEPSVAPDTSTYSPPPSTQPAPPTSSTSEEPTGTARPASEIQPVNPPADAGSPDRTAKVSVGTSAPLASPKPPQGGDASETPATAAAFTDSGDRSGSGSYALLLLVVIVVGLVLGYACVRMWRRRQRRRVEVLKRQRDATWGAVVHQIKMDRQLAASQEHVVPRTSAERQTIDVG
jgi:uncharacterized protein HemX